MYLHLINNLLSSITFTDVSFSSINTSLPQVIEVDPKFKELLKEYKLSNKTTALFISLPKKRKPPKIKIEQLNSVTVMLLKLNFEKQRHIYTVHD